MPERSVFSPAATANSAGQHGFTATLNRKNKMTEILKITLICLLLTPTIASGRCQNDTRGDLATQTDCRKVAKEWHKTKKTLQDPVKLGSLVAVLEADMARCKIGYPRVEETVQSLARIERPYCKTLKDESIRKGSKGRLVLDPREMKENPFEPKLECNKVGRKWSELKEVYRTSAERGFFVPLLKRDLRRCKLQAADIGESYSRLDRYRAEYLRSPLSQAEKESFFGRVKMIFTE